MLANPNLISCNFSFLPFNKPKPKALLKNHYCNPFSLSSSVPNKTTISVPHFVESNHIIIYKKEKGVLFKLQRCHSFLNNTDNSQEDDQVLDKGDGDAGSAKEGRDWTTSILLFVLWCGLMYYVFNLTPDQNPSRDMYFLKKLLYLKGDDGFRMNTILVSLWYIMGFWPLVYSMLLLPTGRSSKTNIPVWPFLILSCFGGAYALLPYFVLWRPPPPSVEESELGAWPLNFLESKLTAGMLLAAGLAVLLYAGLNFDDWKEFYQYFRESKFIHITCLDFALLSVFAPFWVYNDMTSRKWFDKGSWLLLVSLVPFLGPALYLVMRPSISEMPVSLSSTSSEENKGGVFFFSRVKAFQRRGRSWQVATPSA